MLSTARAIAWHEIFARDRPPCYAFLFDVAFVRFELRLTEKFKWSIETLREVCYAFCDREWVGRNVCNLCRNGGLRKLKKTWLTLKTLDMEVKVDLYGFVTFFVDRTQKIKIKSDLRFLTLGTHSNPLKRKPRVPDTRHQDTRTHTI